MAHVSTFLGLDTHRKTIVPAVAKAGEEGAKVLGTIANEAGAVARLMGRLGNPKDLMVCYEAGPCGFGLQRQLDSMGIACIVVAPSLIPRKPGERVKTNRRDALKLAKNLRSGELTPVWVPDPAQEALRDLTRARHGAKQELHRVRQKISKMLLRLGIEQPQEMKARWTQKHEQWLRGLRFDAVEQTIVWECLLEAKAQAEARLHRLEEAMAEAAARSTHAELISALQCLRGVALVTAATWVAELGDVASRFPLPRSLMAYTGLGVKEWSTGPHQWRGGITKTGNSHVRFASVEAAWHYQHRPGGSKALQRRRKGQPEAVVAIAEKAEKRLHDRYWHLVQRGKAQPCAVTAVARELLGFVWAIAYEVECSKRSQPATA